MNKFAMTLAGAGTLLLSPLTVAVAQSQQSTIETMELETVVVTATKRETPLREVPTSIAAIGGDELEQRNAQNFADIVKLVPGVNISTPVGNATRITIRGIAGEANTNPTAGVLYGDLAFTDAYVPHVTLDPNPFDMQGVEVLKGPQGTLFGASALNGAIRYVPAPAELGVNSAKFYAQSSSIHGGDEGFGGGGAVNVAIGDTAALRVVGYGQDLPGWIDNRRTQTADSNGGRQNGGRVNLTWKATDALTFDLTYAGQHSRRDDAPTSDSFAGLLEASNRPRSSPSRQQYDLGSLSIKYDFDAFQLVSQTGLIRKSHDALVEQSQGVVPGGAIPLAQSQDHSDSDTLSQELRLVSNDAPGAAWSWVAGVFAQRQQIEQTSDYRLGDASLPAAVTASALNSFLPGLGTIWAGFGQPNYNNANIDVEVREVAAFFDVTRRFGAGWELGLGGRLYRTRSGGTIDNSGLLMSVAGFPTGRLLNATIEESGFNPKASLLWHANDNVIAYSAVSKGYRVGGPQWGISGLFATAPAPDLFETDEIWNYEIGVRTTWLDNTLSADLTAFYERWTDPQVLILDPTGLGSYIDNVGEVVSRGAEASLQYLVPAVRGLSFIAAASYTDAKTQTAFNTATNQTVPADTEWPLSPRWQTAATLDYQHDFAAWYIGGYITDTYMSEATYGITQPSKVYGYHLWDAQLRLGSMSLPSRPELSLTVSNISDKRGVAIAYSGATFDAVTYAQPRTVTLRLSGKF